MNTHKWGDPVGANPTRYCPVCGEYQQLDVHCLGHRPPKYVRTWRTVLPGDGTCRRAAGIRAGVVLAWLVLVALAIYCGAGP